MTVNKIAENLLLNKICKNCKRQKSNDKSSCVQWLGEACGWQWMPMKEEGTCDDFKGIKC